MQITKIRNSYLGVTWSVPNKFTRCLVRNLFLSRKMSSSSLRKYKEVGMKGSGTQYWFTEKISVAITDVTGKTFWMGQTMGHNFFLMGHLEIGMLRFYKLWKSGGWEGSVFTKDFSSGSWMGQPTIYVTMFGKILTTHRYWNYISSFD